MGVMRTDLWMEDDFQSPLLICKKLEEFFENNNAKEIYNYLHTFGMYNPNRYSWNGFQQMKKDNVWNEVSLLLNHYQKEWHGPHIKVFLFPLNGGGVFDRRTGGKSGVSFKDKMFLFLSPLKDKKELEALFIHEYHHVCRMQKQRKPTEIYTLLDSIILEGSAEYTVKEILGERYVAEWIQDYSHREMEHFWKSFIKKNMNITRDHPLHDPILFGFKGYPAMVGYAMGYFLVAKYFDEERYTVQKSLSLRAERFLPIGE